jgi:hypothetical protein
VLPTELVDVAIAREEGTGAGEESRSDYQTADGRSELFLDQLVGDSADKDTRAEGHYEAKGDHPHPHAEREQTSENQ